MLDKIGMDWKCTEEFWNVQQKVKKKKKKTTKLQGELRYVSIYCMHIQVI